MQKPRHDVDAASRLRKRTIRVMDRPAFSFTCGKGNFHPQPFFHRSGLAGNAMMVCNHVEACAAWVF
ncbi:hypothetical protein VFPFJ_06986 [Purpureocillium lilacinum]|uniref:Uncharacterized protein n=1 Tax=Purpureocillium lilacinum TaxID=33203 RepID=A0A179GQ61_PURLI|nr:hypothetical protein VFPFJ_06986 [Purpureocillium lilacinum]OAQ80076.1 hypothetical protein VFPBJ_05661 [Purpureocillium lilacinum]OAQ88521.1 hypothetical protein VFPFJ_06986 [Purpureocillium lilacinum]